MDKSTKKTVLLCDNDADHSFTLEGELRNRDYEVMIVTDASDLLRSVKSLQPVVVIVNPAVSGFDENVVCQEIMSEQHIPVILLLDRNSTHRGQVGNCRADDVMTKPAAADILANLIAKQMAWHKSNP